MWLPDALGPIKGLAILAQNNDRSIYVKYSKINLEPESRTAKRVLTNLNNVFNSFSILARQHVGARVLPGAIWAFFFFFHMSYVRPSLFLRVMASLYTRNLRKETWGQKPEVEPARSRS